MFLAVATQSSQTLTQDGSSFESASSMYSLARVDAICDDGPSMAAPVEDTLPLPPPPSTKPSPSHSISSSSSGSYCLPGGAKKPAKSISTSPRNSIVKVPIAAIAAKSKAESVSEDEKSEKRYSSSGYYESPHDDGKWWESNWFWIADLNGYIYNFAEPARQRRCRDWNEEERRRRKEKMRLDIEKENMKSLTSPTTTTTTAIATPKPVAAFKQISPDDRVALNTLDGANATKSKRIRPKTRRYVRDFKLYLDSYSQQIHPNRSPRARNVTEDPISRKVKTPIMISPERTDPMENPMCRISPTKYQQVTLTPCHNVPTHSICKKRLVASPEKRLKALSTESLRSVSPGSDSVFYSEADVIIDHQVHLPFDLIVSKYLIFVYIHAPLQVHCHHCGKEVEIITAADGSQEDLGHEEDRPNIVKPPADFADSPDGPRTPHHPTRLYKKMDKRFRSEERHGDRRHYRSRQESTRAKVGFNREILLNRWKIMKWNICICRVKSVAKTTHTQNVSCVRPVRVPVLSSKAASMYAIKSLIPNKAFTMDSIASARGFVSQTVMSGDAMISVYKMVRDNWRRFNRRCENECFLVFQNEPEKYRIDVRPLNLKKISVKNIRRSHIGWCIANRASKCIVARTATHSVSMPLHKYDSLGWWY